jgi:hypothetical protein
MFNPDSGKVFTEPIDIFLGRDAIERNYKLIHYKYCRSVFPTVV